MVETMQQRADAILPRILTLTSWLAAKYPSMNWSESSEEITAADTLLSARYLDYKLGGPEEPVKDAILKWGRAHIGVR